MAGPVSVVIPAFNAEGTLARVLAALTAQARPGDEVVVVDDASTDRTPAVAADAGARVIANDPPGFAGGARNHGWDEARSDTVVFLDADAVPDAGWRAGLDVALDEFPGAIVGCARSFSGRSPWSWVAHLQVETPYLPRGRPREVPFVSSYCMAVPRAAGVRFDPSYGGEDALFCLDATAAGLRLVFDPRFTASHEHQRDTFADLRRQQDRLAYGLARLGPVQREGAYKRLLSRVPAHYFALARLPAIYRRLDGDDVLRRQFLHHLPRLAVAEWSLGVAAVRYAVRPRPPLRGQTRADFRR